MNYAKLSERGFKYLMAAGDNWNRRQRKIMHSCDYRNRKAFKIFNELENRKLAVAKILHVHKERMRQQQIEADHQQVLLMCPNFIMHYSEVATAIAVYIKDYEPNKFFCDICGSELTLDGKKHWFQELGLHS